MEIDKRVYQDEDHSYKMLREQSFQWIDALLGELKVEQAANERGACLEGLGSVFEKSVYKSRDSSTTADNQRQSLRTGPA